MIYNTLGELVSAQIVQINYKELKMNLSESASGIYYIKIVSKNHSNKNYKIIIQ